MKQKNTQVVKFREKLRLLKNWTPHLPLGHFKLMFFFSEISTLIIHRWTFDIQWSYMKDLMTLLHCVCAVQGTQNLKWRSELSWRVCQCLKLRIKNKMRKGNHLYEIEVREVDKEMTGSKFTTKVLAKIQIRWVAWLWFFIWPRRISLH